MCFVLGHWPFETQVRSLFLFGLCRLEQLKSIMEAAANLCKWCKIPQKLFKSCDLTNLPVLDILIEIWPNKYSQVAVTFVVN